MQDRKQREKAEMLKPLELACQHVSLAFYILHSAFCIPRNLASLAQRRKEEKEVQHGITVDATRRPPSSDF